VEEGFVGFSSEADPADSCWTGQYNSTPADKLTKKLASDKPTHRKKHQDAIPILLKEEEQDDLGCGDLGHPWPKDSRRGKEGVDVFYHSFQA